MSAPRRGTARLRPWVRLRKVLEHALVCDVAIKGMDLACDPDGRFRVNETYCHAETWQKAVQLLLGRSDKVLMDLRGFSSGNVGCVFELEQMFEHLPSGSIFLIVDSSTDFTQLGPVVDRAWSRVSPSVTARGHGAVNLVRIEKSGTVEAQLLFKCLARVIVAKRAVALVAFTRLRARRSRTRWRPFARGSGRRAVPAADVRGVRAR